jgi:hypothetical protein
MRVTSIKGLILNEISRQIVISEGVTSVPTRVITKQIISENIDKYYIENVGITLGEAAASNISMTAMNMSLVLNRLFQEDIAREVEKISEFNKRNGTELTSELLEMMNSPEVSDTDRRIIGRTIDSETLSEGAILDWIIAIGTFIPKIGSFVGAAGAAYYFINWWIAPEGSEERALNFWAGIFTAIAVVPGIGAALGATFKAVILPIVRAMFAAKQFVMGGKATLASVKGMGSAETAVMNMMGSSTRTRPEALSLIDRLKSFATPIIEWFGKAAETIASKIPGLGSTGGSTFFSKFTSSFRQGLDDLTKYVDDLGRSADEIAALQKSAAQGSTLAKTAVGTAPGFFSRMSTGIGRVIGNSRLALAFSRESGKIMAAIGDNVYIFKQAGRPDRSVKIAGLGDDGMLVISAERHGSPIGKTTFSNLSKPNGGSLMDDVMGSGLSDDTVAAIRSMENARRSNVGRAGLVAVGGARYVKTGCFVEKDEHGAVTDIYTGEELSDECFTVAQYLDPSSRPTGMIDPETGQPYTVQQDTWAALMTGYRNDPNRQRASPGAGATRAMPRERDVENLDVSESRDMYVKGDITLLQLLS